MAFYDDQTIEQVQRATDIVSLIQDYVPLKRAGRSYKACCPFHKEKTPSFMVNPDRQTYHCFGCGAGGDVFEFVMKLDGLNFPEAVRHLAGLVHIDLPETSTPHDTAKASRKEKLFGIYEMAQRFFRAHYADEQHGKPARDYMLGRKFDANILNEFGIGYAPAQPRIMFDALKNKGVPETDLLSSGLVSRTQYGNLLDLFRGRIIFPISNVQGKIIGFGGRVLGDELPKYINSPESELFKKRCELFGLHLAKKHVDRDDPYMIVVEGYLDAIRLHEAGVRNAVATLGTALTEEHARLLKRYVREIVLVFDGDAAGQAASLRSLETFLEEDMSVKLVAMPEGFDPDDFVRDRGGEAFRELVKQSEDIFTFKLKLLMKRYNHKEPKGLVAITKEMISTFSKIPNAVLVDRYVKQLSIILGVDERSIALELEKVRDKLSARPKAALANEETSEAKNPRTSQVPFQAEFAIISLMAEDEALAQSAIELAGEDDFQNREAADIFQRIRTCVTEGKEVSVRHVLHWELSSALKSYLSAHPYAHLSPDERMKALEHCIFYLRRKVERDQLAEIQLEIKRAETAGDDTRVTYLVREFQEKAKSHRHA